MKNQRNEKIVADYLKYLQEEEKGEKDCKLSALNYLRDFFEDRNFSEIVLEDLKQFFLYLRQTMKCSDQFTMSIAEELRRFFGFLSKRGINANWMKNIMPAAHKGGKKHRK